MRSIPTRRAWAPFVGVALAALTAGSLITFSVIAQRTSLDGLSDERVIAASPVVVQPPSITIEPVAGSDGASKTTEAGAGEASGTTPVPAFLVAAEAPAGPTTVDATEDDSTVAQSPTAERLGGPLAAEESFVARNGGGGRAEADDEPVLTVWDERHGGKHTYKSHDLKARSNGSEGERAKKAKGSAHRGPSAHRGTPKRASSARGLSKGSAAPGKRASSSKSRPAVAKKSSPSRRPAAKSKSRGRGHRRH